MIYALAWSAFALFRAGADDVGLPDRGDSWLRQSIVGSAVVYLGEHYLVDVLAGSVMAVGGTPWVRRKRCIT